MVKILLTMKRSVKSKSSGTTVYADTVGICGGGSNQSNLQNRTFDMAGNNDMDLRNAFYIAI